MALFATSCPPPSPLLPYRTKPIVATSVDTRLQLHTHMYTIKTDVQESSIFFLGLINEARLLLHPIRPKKYF